MKRQALLGSAAIVICVAAGSLLAPQAASALDFTYSYTTFQGLGVTGLIEGLSEGRNACLSTDSCRVTVTNNGGTGAPVGPYNFILLGDDSDPEDFEFEVVTSSGGGYSIAATSHWNGTIDPTTPIEDLTVALQFLPFSEGVFGNLVNSGNAAFSLGPVQFNYVPGSGPGAGTDVPGPIPLFGAAAAFGYSRRLRRRIKGSSNTVTTAPFS